MRKLVSFARAGLLPFVYQKLDAVPSPDIAMVTRSIDTTAMTVPDLKYSMYTDHEKVPICSISRSLSCPGDFLDSDFPSVAILPSIEFNLLLGVPFDTIEACLEVLIPFFFRTSDHDITRRRV